MITTNLKSILESKNLSVNQVSKDTGISRQVITNLMTNKSKGVQFNTIDILTDYLKITVSDFFYKVLKNYVVFINHKQDSLKDINLLDGVDVTLTLKVIELSEDKGEKNSYDLPINLSIIKNTNKIVGFSLYLMTEKLDEHTLQFSNDFFNGLTDVQLDDITIEFWNFIKSNLINIPILGDRTLYIPYNFGKTNSITFHSIKEDKEIFRFRTENKEKIFNVSVMSYTEIEKIIAEK